MLYIAHDVSRVHAIVVSLDVTQLMLVRLALVTLQDGRSDQMSRRSWAPGLSACCMKKHRLFCRQPEPVLDAR